MPDRIAKKLYIATPAYDGCVTAAYANSLLRTFVACGMAGIECVNDFKLGCCYVDFARNYLVHRFLKSDADTLLFIDADIGWPEAAVIKLYESHLAMVGGVYPMKQTKEQFPIELLGVEQKGYHEAVYLPTGFLMIRRVVFERLLESGQIPQYIDKQLIERVHAFFQCVVAPEAYTGEDVEFCNRWRRVGGRIWCWPDIDFEHQGFNIWHGNYAHHLSREMPVRITLASGRKEAA